MSAIKALPDEKSKTSPASPAPHLWESTLPFLRDPYRYISRECDRLGTNAFRTRLLFQDAVMMRGPEAAKLFYNENFFVRRKAPPRRLVVTFFGKGAVQGLDEQAHRQRKQLFMTLITDAQLEKLRRCAWEEWTKASLRWRTKQQIVFYEEAREVMFRTACRWAEVPIDEKEVATWTNQIASIYEDAASVGPRYWRARANRTRLDRRLSGIIEGVHNETLKPSTQSALNLFAHAPNADGTPLSVRIAARELQNLIRPTTAVSVFITQAFLALHQFPSSKSRLHQGNETDLLNFVQEVRRYFPFFPAVIARAKSGFRWKGISFRKGTRAVLDLYGANHDPSVWESPHEFRPERFENWNGDPFTFIPQGGGDPLTNHRCPGEKMAIELMKVSLDFLLQNDLYEVPPQDLDLTWNAPPALPRSGLILKLRPSRT